MRGVAGPDYRGTLDRVLPGAFDDAVADADTFFGQELPAVGGWSFGPAEAKRIQQPALVVLGGRSHEVTPAYGRRTALLLDWLPDATRYVLPDATHLMHLQNPIAMAERLAGFFGLHPIRPPQASEPSA
jgi:pimeloyl-ACP methyl ester carboxylesterase